MSTRTDLERDLRTAARSFDVITVSPDAWQQNQRRLTAARAHRLPQWLGIAAAVTAVLLLASLVFLASRGSESGPPAHGGGDDSFATENLLGPVISLETVTVNGERTVHEAALSDSSGKGPSLCDRYVAQSSAAGGCTARDPNADDPDVAIDWLSGSGGTGEQHGMVAGVDSRAAEVKIWTDDGQELEASLRPGGWEGTHLLGLTIQAGGATPQRLVAIGPGGEVLQAVDLAERFGPGWLPDQPACGNFPTAPTGVYPGSVRGDEINVRASSTAATIQIVTNAGSLTASQCVALSAQSLAGVSVAGRVVVVVVGPEVDLVRLRSPTSEVEDKPRPLSSSLWRISIMRLRSMGEFDTADLLAFDVTGRNILRVNPLRELRSTQPQNVTQE